MKPETLETILEDIQSALDEVVPLLPGGTVQADALIAESLSHIVVSALKAFTEHKGEPFDLNQLPDEDLVQ